MKCKAIILFFILFISFKLTAQQNRIQSNIKAKLNWTGKCGNWNFSQRIFKGQGFIRYNIAYYNRSLFTDFIYEVKINKFSEDGTFGILLRYDELRNVGYALQFWPHGGCIFSINRRGVHLRKIEINQPINQLIGTRVWNTLKVIAHSSKFEIYLNDILLDTVIDNTFQSGRLGLCLEGDPRQVALFEVIRIEPL